MRAWVGTSGFAFKPWKGPFYPPELADRDMLRHFCERLPAVEINNTFYQLPRTAAVASWHEQTAGRGDRFRFAIKASQKITHWKRLAGADEETRYLLRAIEPLGERLGCVLYQLPPNLKLDLPRLEAFLELLAAEAPAIRAAFEFRHRSWAEADSGREVLDLLGRHGCAWVLAETDEDGAGDAIAWRDSGAGWGYARLRREAYGEADLDRWAQRLRASGWSDAYVFFKHEDAAVGPRLAAELLARLAAS